MATNFWDAGNPFWQQWYARGLAVANMWRDDPSTLPGDDPFLRAH